MKKLAVLVFILLGFTGCTQDKPRPEGNVDIVPLNATNIETEAIEVISQKDSSSMNLKHYIRNQKVYVECYIPNFTFKQKGGRKEEGEGHLALYVDDKKIEDITTAAFIIKGLEKGSHRIKVEVVHNDTTSYNLKKEWNVTIH